MPTYTISTEDWDDFTNTIVHLSKFRLDTSKLDRGLKSIVPSIAKYEKLDQLDRLEYDQSFEMPTKRKAGKHSMDFNYKLQVNLDTASSFPTMNVYANLSYDLKIDKDAQTFEIPSVTVTVLADDNGYNEISKKFKFQIAQTTDIQEWRKIILKTMQTVVSTVQSYVDTTVTKFFTKSLQVFYGGRDQLPSGAGRPSTRQQVMFASLSRVASQLPRQLQNDAAVILNYVGNLR